MKKLKENKKAIAMIATVILFNTLVYVLTPEKDYMMWRTMAIATLIFPTVVEFVYEFILKKDLNIAHWTLTTTIGLFYVFFLAEIL